MDPLYQGSAVPGIGEEVSNNKMIFLFKNGASREYFQLPGAFSYVVPIILLKPRIDELFLPCRQSLVEPRDSGQGGAGQQGLCRSR